MFNRMQFVYAVVAGALLLVLMEAIRPEYADGAQVNADRSKELVIIAGSTTVDVINPEADIDAVVKSISTGVDYVKKSGQNVKFDREPIKKIGFSSLDDLKTFLSRPAQSPDLTIFCYIKLHGYTNQQEQHVTALDDGKTEVTRDLILNTLKTKNARLLVLITESCAASPTQTYVAESQGPDYPTQLFDDLFLKAKGIVNINSSTYRDANKVHNQYAWMENGGRGLFTNTLTASLSIQAPTDVTKLQAAVDKNRNGIYSWQEFIELLASKTDDKYVNLRKRVIEKGEDNVPPSIWKLIQKQDHQFPQTFGQLPGEPGGPRP